jgi:vesicle-fusing ATPase
VFGNLAAVSNRDFPNAVSDTLLDVKSDGESYIVTARAIPECRPGEIGLTEFQRSWMELSMGPDSFVEVSPFTAPVGTKDADAIPYAGRIEVDITWARPNQTTEQPFPQKELAERFLFVHENQVFHVGQPLVLNFKGMPNVVIRIISIQPLDFGTEKPVPVRRAVASRSTEFVVRKSGPRLAGAAGPTKTNAILSSNFQFEELGIGGLDKEFNIIFRKAFGSRLLDPAVSKQLGLQHVRGLLLYGPPGTGKTLIARQIGKSLNTRPPKIINGPEVLNKYVGQSEENVRKIFEDAEKEYKEKGDDSGLHIIIFDELDAVCKQRGSGAGGNTGVGDTIVNQLLTKMDGVEQLNNILLIGMTNRKDMIDEALLRPGRMEIHLEISLPDEFGRLQILRIHTAKLKESNSLASDVDLADIAKQTKNYSGAELAGLIRSASSYAIYRATGGPGAAIKQISNTEAITVTKKDFQDALEETTPMFGVSEEFIEQALSFGIVHFNENIGNILTTGKELAGSFGQGVNLISVLLWGPSGSGKTALAAQMAVDSEAPFIQKIRMNDFIGMTELQRIQAIERVFRDADRVSILKRWHDTNVNRVSCRSLSWTKLSF